MECRILGDGPLKELQGLGVAPKVEKDGAQCVKRQHVLGIRLDGGFGQDERFIEPSGAAVGAGEIHSDIVRSGRQRKGLLKMRHGVRRLIGLDPDEAAEELGADVVRVCVGDLAEKVQRPCHLTATVQQSGEVDLGLLVARILR